MLQKVTGAAIALAATLAGAGATPALGAEAVDVLPSASQVHSLVAKDGPVTANLVTRPIHKGDILWDLIANPDYYTPQTQVESMWITWGDDAVLIPPDAYVTILDPRHMALGHKGKTYTLLIQTGDDVVDGLVEIKFNRRRVLEETVSGGESGDIVERTVYY